MTIYGYIVRRFIHSIIFRKFCGSWINNLWIVCSSMKHSSSVITGRYASCFMKGVFFCWKVRQSFQMETQSSKSSNLFFCLFKFFKSRSFLNTFPFHSEKVLKDLSPECSRFLILFFRYFSWWLPMKLRYTLVSLRECRFFCLFFLQWFNSFKFVSSSIVTVLIVKLIRIVSFSQFIKRDLHSIPSFPVIIGLRPILFSTKWVRDVLPLTVSFVINSNHSSHGWTIKRL